MSMNIYRTNILKNVSEKIGNEDVRFLNYTFGH